MIIFVFGYTFDFKKTNNANVFVTRIGYYANFEKRLTLIKTFFFKSESETGKTGASITTRRIKFPEAVRTSAERAIASLLKFKFTTRARG